MWILAVGLYDFGLGTELLDGIDEEASLCCAVLGYLGFQG